MFKKDLCEYFDIFVEKLVINWLVVIENVFKFVINQNRINLTYINLLKKPT